MANRRTPETDGREWASVDGQSNFTDQLEIVPASPGFKVVRSGPDREGYVYRKLGVSPHYRTKEFAERFVAAAKAYKPQPVDAYKDHALGVYGNPFPHTDPKHGQYKRYWKCAAATAARRAERIAA